MLRMQKGQYCYCGYFIHFSYNCPISTKDISPFKKSENGLVEWLKW
jgi:hypothetical protein